MDVVVHFQFKIRCKKKSRKAGVGMSEYRKSKRRHNDPEGLAVAPRDGETAESLIRRFKWLVEGSGLLRDLKDREFARSPSAKRKFKERKAAARRKKAASKESKE